MNWGGGGLSKIAVIRMTADSVSIRLPVTPTSSSHDETYIDVNNKVFYSCSFNIQLDLIDKGFALQSIVVPFL